MNLQSGAGSGKGHPLGVAELAVLANHIRKPVDGWPEVMELVLEAPGWSSKPGQFVMLRPLDWDQDPVWARPFSIAEHTAEGLSLLVQVAGRGTAKLTKLAQGQRVALWGPLGNNFKLAPGIPTLMAAGGIGLAPFIGYAASHPKPDNLRLLFGHRLPPESYPLNRFDGLARTEFMHEREPGDLELFCQRLEERMLEHKDGQVLACGPKPFLRTVRKLALKHDVPCQLSLENAMACGVGACLGCVVADPEGKPVAVCTRGPVFEAASVDLDRKIGEVARA